MSGNQASDYLGSSAVLYVGSNSINTVYGAHASSYVESYNVPMSGTLGYSIQLWYYGYIETSAYTYYHANSADKGYMDYSNQVLIPSYGCTSTQNATVPSAYFTATA